MEKIDLKTAREISGTGSQALYVAIKKGRLKAAKGDNNRIHLDKKDLMSYLERKYDRKDSKFEGKLKWDKKKGEYSVSEAAEYLNVPSNLLYYYIRSRKMGYMKKGCSYVLHIEEMLRVKTNLIDR